MELTPDELQILERDRIYVSARTFRQCFEPYMPEETMERFITSDSLLNGFHFLLERTVKYIEERNAERLKTALLVTWEALETNAIARILIGVALRLLEEEVELGTVAHEVEIEVARVLNASDCLLPQWLAPPSADLIAVDYRRFQVRSFYTANTRLCSYFRATAWLKSIPLRVERDAELEEAWQLARAQGHAQTEWKQIRSSYSWLGVPGDWDLGIFTGQESFDDFRRKARELPVLPLNDQFGFSSGQSLRVLAGIALPDSIFFHEQNPDDLPRPDALVQLSALHCSITGRLSH